MTIYEYLHSIYSKDTDAQLFLSHIYPNNSINSLPFRSACAMLDKCYNNNTDRFIKDASGYVQLYEDFPLDKKPQRIAHDFFGHNFSVPYMESEIERINQIDKLCDYKQVFTWLNPNAVMKNEHGHLLPTNFYEEVDHFDFTQLYPHIALKCARGTTADRLEDFIRKSIRMKESKDPRRPLVKLMLNSYWGYASCSDLTFKKYMLFTENALLETAYGCFDRVLMVKTDGVYGNGFNAKKLSDMIDIPFDDEYDLTMFILNVSNYGTLNSDFTECNLTGVRFRNGLSKLPFSTFSFLPVGETTSGLYRDGCWIEHTYDSNLEGRLSAYMKTKRRQTEGSSLWDDSANSSLQTNPD